jgi:hypothetical protein
LAASLVLHFDMPLLMLVVIVLAKLGIDVAAVARERRG